MVLLTCLLLFNYHFIHAYEHLEWLSLKWILVLLQTQSELVKPPSVGGGL